VVGQGLAALPEGQGFLESDAAGFQSLHNLDELVPGVLVAELGEVGLVALLLCRLVLRHGVFLLQVCHRWCARDRVLVGSGLVV
jgi:hypothetical protein